MVEPVHIAVKGRARYKVEGLYSSETLKQYLELRLVQEKDIIKVSASTLTGNILVSYNSDNTYQTIQSLIEKALQDASTPSEADESVTTSDIFDESEGHGKDTVSRPFFNLSYLQAAINRLLLPHAKRMNRPWHTFRGQSVLENLETPAEIGLNSAEIAERYRRYGPNRLPESKGRSGFEIFMEQVNSLPTYLLAAAAGVSLLTGGLVDAVVVIGVVAANAAIGYITESEAEKTIDSLRNLVHPKAEVLRDGKKQEIDAEEVVLGDVLLLKPGTYVAADARVIQYSRLSVDESMLTGESIPVNKNNRKLLRENVPLADRKNMVFAGTQVTGGEGLAVVVATGRYTEIGQLQLLLKDTTTPKTPIERQLGKIGDHLVLLFLAICGLVFLVGFMRGFAVLQMLRMAISLAASAVPEGLPAAATINMALGITRMKNHRALIRNLQAVETLGAVQTICLDKTGTITQNRMTVTHLFSEGHQYAVENRQIMENGRMVDPLSVPNLKRMLIVGALCNETKINGSGNGKADLAGSATETALIHLAIDAGMDIETLRRDYPSVRVNYRSENRLYMTTLHTTSNNGRQFLAVKGSPPEVLDLCGHQLLGDRIVPLSEAEKLDIIIQNEAMSNDALRVLGFACADVDPLTDGDPMDGLVWIGLCGMSDPIREGVKNLIRDFHRAGIETIMITGDQSTTAYAIARQIDLSGGDRLDILDSTELQTMDDDALEALAKRVKVYSRVSPADKLKIVKALQSAGRTVAMTGDGINDGPALKAANIGIAMGRSGTDVARETADIVLEEDNLETLLTAVADGRGTYRNIRKSVHFFLATNMTEIMVMSAALVAGLGFPLNVMQLLWINIISDIFPGIALSMETPEPNILEQPPREADAPLFSNKDYGRMMGESAVISAASMGAYVYGITQYGGGARAASLAFQSLTAGQLMHAYNCRDESRQSSNNRKLPRNTYLDIAIGGSLVLQLLTIVLPSLRGFLGLTALNPVDVAVAGGSAMLAHKANKRLKTI
jgi:Ca2+-transporting ATPase